MKLRTDLSTPSTDTSIWHDTGFGRQSAPTTPFFAWQSCSSGIGAALMAYTRPASAAQSGSAVVPTSVHLGAPAMDRITQYSDAASIKSCTFQALERKQRRWMDALGSEFAASGLLRRFVRLPSGSSGTQTHSQRLAAAATARSRTAACLAFPAVALVLYLAMFGLPGRPSRSAATVSQRSCQLHE